MSKLEIKEKVLNIIGRMDFSESLELKMDCPTCHGKGTVIRRITIEKQQKMKGKWFVEVCSNEECDYWNAGFCQ